ncbi:next to BRCA1 gene 1 protein-like [Mizuhopecten yessoensis]|uniref:Next to BRCA1 gene 1 protein n=1 Tax=Mizuhopecten yessoensis TaxID=6573 RepID=A0A210QRI8_MIZYE|nr:next to BRCA1 gene 1 protein-like [Mizuhopecten yessoensis]OWF51345.1 Next to BRCA1 gene 1 protein [Mizuhopecten yessoensis]
MEDIVFNVKFEGETIDPEIFCLPPQTKWMDLEAMLKAQYDCEHVQIFYIDPEGDYVAFCSQEELEEAVRIADKFSRTLHLIVRDLGPDPEPDRIAPINTPTEAGKSDKADTATTVKPTQETEGPKVIGEGAKVKDDGSNVDGQMAPEMIIHVDDATGEMTETTRVEVPLDTIIEMIGKTASHPHDVIDETGETTPLLPTISEDKPRPSDKKLEKKVKTRKLVKESRRQTQSADRGAKPKKLALDLESGESDEVAMPYSVFVKFMQQLKMELRTEIVKDVTKKTVRHVLKGLDGAVIQSVKGTSEVDPAVTSPTGGQGEATPKTETPSSHPIYYHEGIICNFCERVIVGVRYKCCYCVDYDLCEECEAVNGVHDSDHVFLKLRKPTTKLRRLSPLFKTSLYPQREGTPRDEAIPEALPQEQVNQDCMTQFLQSKFEKIQEKTARKQERLRRKEEKLLHKQRRKEELLKRRLDTQRDEPLKRERLELPFKRNVGYDASFLYDVTIPDGTNVQPGTKLLKTWRMKNTGSHTWNERTKLHLVYGSFPSLNRHQDMDILPLSPGDEADISVQLTAPERPGKYQSHWKMTQSGKQFGHRVWCLITVVPREVLEPTQDGPLKLVYDHDTVQNEAAPEEQVMEKSCEEAEHFTERKETEELLTVREEIVTKKDVDLKEEYEEVSGEEVKDEEVKDDEVKDGDKVKLEQDLSTAAAAVAQLKLDQCQQPVTSETGQDLMSFELLNLANRGSHKVSQTATPNNTPLDVTPPKSPAPELEDIKALSTSSSVEVVNAEPEDLDRDDHLSGQYVRDIMDNLHAPKLDDVDIESLKSYTDEDDSSLSEDDDFLIVPMPACFDFSKPVISRSIIDDFSDDDDADEEEDVEIEEVDDNHNTITTRGSSVDDLLTTSGALSTQPLDPKPVEEKVNSQEETPDREPSEPSVVAATAAEMPQKTDPEETVVMTVYSSAAGAAGVYDEAPSHTGSGVSSGSVESDEGEVTNMKEPIEDVHPADGGVATNDQSENGATAENRFDHDSTGQHGVPPDMFVNQVMATAVKAANKAASNAYTTCKEVFYTWQARAYQNGTRQPGQKYKPPQSTWKPKEEKDKVPTVNQPDTATGQQGNTYVPPKSAWKPQEEKYKPPTSDWMPPQDKWTPPEDKWAPDSKKSETEENCPMTKLIEMGFCNREMNQKLLEKHGQNVEAVIQELLSEADNDWMERRH